jgi:hypothetical protein
MHDQLTVRLPKDLSRALAAASRRLQRKQSDMYLGLAPGSGQRAADRVRSLIGSLESGVPDLAERHRTYIVESLRRGR